LKPDEIPPEIREKIIAEFGSIEKWLSSPRILKLGVCSECGEIGLVKIESESDEDRTRIYQVWHHTSNMPKEWSIAAMRRCIRCSPKTRFSVCKCLLRSFYRVPMVRCPRCRMWGRPFTSNRGYRFVRHRYTMCYLGKPGRAVVKRMIPIE
jgi:hypothetical protein